MYDLFLSQFSVALLKKICADLLNQRTTNLTGPGSQEERHLLQLDQVEMPQETVSIYHDMSQNFNQSCSVSTNGFLVIFCFSFRSLLKKKVKSNLHRESLG